MDQPPLPFFPESFPDETLWSRVSRYHLLTGNSGEDTTFRELFGKRLALEQIVPAAAIQALAPKLPGEVKDTTATLVRENTLLPAFAPFLGNDGQPIEQEIPVGSHYDGLGRFPKRVVGEYGGVHKLCLSCLREDIAFHGTGYWHRCHQVPGVRACWKHRESLVSNCPICRRPVSRLRAFPSLPWKPCPCGWTPSEHGGQTAASEAEKRYAEFAQANSPSPTLHCCRTRQAAIDWKRSFSVVGELWRRIDAICWRDMCQGAAQLKKALHKHTEFRGAL